MRWRGGRSRNVRKSLADARITKYLETGILDGPPRDIERLISGYLHCVGLIRYKGVRIGTNEITSPSHPLHQRHRRQRAIQKPPHSD